MFLAAVADLVSEGKSSSVYLTLANQRVFILKSRLLHYAALSEQMLRTSKISV